MELRKLTLEEVEFTVTTEPELEGPEGHFSCSDEEVDREMMDEINERIRKGDSIAWCTLVVTAKWKDFVVTNTLGACSFADVKDLEGEVEAYGMKQEALDSLQGNIQSVFDMLIELTPSEVRRAVINES